MLGWEVCLPSSGAHILDAVSLGTTLCCSQGQAVSGGQSHGRALARPGPGGWVKVQAHACGYSMLARVKYLWCRGHWIGIPS